ncbi:acyclic terpene utilization AtuA family protein [Geomicrobium sp. JCM 19039]|uniref:acyclic terpene utilization AtuA family protein n=1 Tax=Geomicrobium sp. JCM 19039 TaxID=1460636 RepID=UPI00045F2076|nr:acyclic terpene utilization AtuA family protein [Geomicrobium sp. JCM 19039]GAK13705.1 hypothetical protein JCM19039_3572 [Geomicrobium sp. JCM 19039]
MRSIRIGTGAGYSGDRIDAAVDLVERGNLDYLVLEGLAERTTALAHLEKREDPEKGYGQFFEARMYALLALCKRKNVRIVTNLGAANPQAAARVVVRVARDLDMNGLRVATVLGADVASSIAKEDPHIWETGEPVSHSDWISADAYLGVEEMLPALAAGVDVIITGRVADPSLFLAPMVSEWGWSLTDWDRLGKGTVLAHLLECGAQVTGGYFADGQKKRVDDLLHVGMPIVEVFENGEGIISKTPGSGGLVSVQTCKEQLLYEVMDPSTYITPDVVADFSNVQFQEVAENCVHVTGGSGNARTDSFKVTLGVNQGFIGEGFIAYAGHGAIERAQMAQAIVEQRLKDAGIHAQDMKSDLVGMNALHGDAAGRPEPYEVMFRIAARAANQTMADRVGEEVESLWLNGPGGPGGVRKYTRPVIAAYSTTIRRSAVKSNVKLVEVDER